MCNIAISSFISLLILLTTNCTKYEDNDAPSWGSKGDTTVSSVKLVVASHHADCIGVDAQKCYLVKEGDDTDWDFLYCAIDGFDYEEGNEYELAVKISPIANPPSDVTSVRYTLVKVVSKVKKESEGLPSWLH